MSVTSAIIWDFDGTLAERPGLWSQCLAELVNESLGLAMTRESFVPFLKSGFPWHAPDAAHTHLDTPEAWWAALEPLWTNALVRGANVEPALACSLSKKVRERYIDPAAWRVYPDTRSALTLLSRAGWVHVVLSNHVPELPSLVGALGLGDRFLAVLSSAAIGYEKPRVECFNAARSCLPGSVQRIVVVGDSHSADMVGASTAGLEGILVRSGSQGGYQSFDNLERLAAHLTVT